MFQVLFDVLLHLVFLCCSLSLRHVGQIDYYLSHLADEEYQDYGYDLISEIYGNPLRKWLKDHPDRVLVQYLGKYAGLKVNKTHDRRVKKLYPRHETTVATTTSGYRLNEMGNEPSSYSTGVEDDQPQYILEEAGEELPLSRQTEYGRDSMYRKMISVQPNLSKKELAVYKMFAPAECPGSKGKPGKPYSRGLCNYPCKSTDYCERENTKWICCPCLGAFSGGDLTFSCIDPNSWFG